MEKKVREYIEKFKHSMQDCGHTDASIKKQNIDFVMKMSRIIEMNPGVKKGQSRFIAEKSLLIAGGLDMSAVEQKNILYAGLMIQIGKILLPDNLLLKPFFSMTDVEKYHYLGHAVDVDILLKELTQFEAATTLIRHQYERYNGQGFPDNLVGQNIPLGSRILSVVSDYVAYLDGTMTGRPMFTDVALSQIMIRKESYYDPDIVEIFVNVLKGLTIEELKEAIAKAKLVSIATERWKKGLLMNTRNNSNRAVQIVEVSLQQLKLGMKVSSIHFGIEPYIRDCIVDQSIIDSVSEFKKKNRVNPIIKIFLTTG
jgi:response regulator RpfG family c-di-GMP phosphodiesterase